MTMNVGDRVGAALDAAIAGRVSAVHLHGPRGAGKSWWLDEVARHAHQRSMTIARARGSDQDLELPFSALSMLLAMFRKRLDDPAWESLKTVVEFDHRKLDAFDVKLASFQFLCALAAEQPVCLVLDDVHLFDAASIEVLTFVLRRADADAIACVSAGVLELGFPFANTVRLDPLSNDVVTTLLIERGVAANAAARCAEAADGNPGIGVALAEGLTAQQRAGTAPISALPRPSGMLVDDLQRRLREYGEAACRALVVAAAEHGGDTAAVRGALVALGETSDGFDRAEAIGLIEIVGARFNFTDPWIRTVAYHLVAPASRRAAHSALAAWFDSPEQAAERAWHLAAGADGPSDAVASALQMVANDAGRRGALASAALMAERAAEFATTPAGRQRHVLAALDWWMSATNTEGVRRVLRAVDPLDLEGVCARAEALEFVDGAQIEVRVEPSVLRSLAVGQSDSWILRREQRRTIDDATDRGDHRSALARLEADHDRVQRDARDHVSRAVAFRHAGRLRDARDAAIMATAMLEGSGAYPVWNALLISADLDVLQARSDDAISTLQSIRERLPAAYHERAAVLTARSRLQLNPTCPPGEVTDAFIPLGSGVLREIRELIRDGALNADVEALQRAIELAELHLLPVEAGEARLWLAAAQPVAERRRTSLLCRATLQRCGVRAWDSRLDSYGDGDTPPRATRRADPGLDALSQAEFRVADAVAGGLTNRQVAASLLISVKTVDFHLQQMYRKLGIRSRTELAVRMANFEPTAKGDRHE
jgi:DNA-binding CsgD family transcriptional regulator